MKSLRSVTPTDILGMLKSVDKKTWAVVGAAVVGAGVLWLGIIDPAWLARPALRRQIEDMRRQIIQVSGLNEKKPLLESNLKEFNDLLRETQARLFTPDQIGLLLGQVSKMAKESRVEVIASRPLGDKLVYPAPYNAKYAAQGYEFTVIGGYHELGGLIARIESHEKLLRVHRMNLSVPDEAQGRIRAELKVLAFTVAPPLPPGKATAQKAPNVKK
ncbi:MAG: type 4a pilus biogenesis protein PilO [Candidatus Omnitrophica bacterium]|nr:type 4a pilus biogenesis protein PilO [Candidatus Omnitrophota bacterium]